MTGISPFRRLLSSGDRNSVATTLAAGLEYNKEEILRRSHRALAAAVSLAAVAALPAGAAQAATKSVFGGPARPPKTVPKMTDITEFFPKKVKIHKGDNVEFNFRGFHTFTFLGKAKFPAFFIPTGSKVADAKDAAGNPFWFNGQDRLKVNPDVAFPIGDKVVDNRAMESSGMPQDDDPQPYRLKFPKTGTFNYVCLIHPKMKGQVTVVNKRKRIPSRRSDEARAAKQLAAAVNEAKRLVKPKNPGGANVLAGNSSKDVEVLHFFPKDLTVKAGQTVQWRAPHPHDFHTVTFGPPEYLQPIGQSFIAPDTTAPQGGPPTLLANPLVVYPSDPPTATPTYDGSNHGNGFLNSGIFEGDPDFPLPDTSRITFSKPGTYNYLCLVHGPDMSGKVTVTQ